MICFVTEFDKSIDLDFVRRFCREYYPELRITEGGSLLGALGHVVFLQKNPWVCACFAISHSEKKNRTSIVIGEEGNFWGRLLGGSLVRLFVKGSFYHDVSSDFEAFLHKEEKQIIEKG